MNKYKPILLLIVLIFTTMTSCRLGYSNSHRRGEIEKGNGLSLSPSKLEEHVPSGLPDKKSRSVETNSSTACNSNSDCWCRPFDGSKFLEGAANSVCCKEVGPSCPKVNHCADCQYE